MAQLNILCTSICCSEFLITTFEISHLTECSSYSLVMSLILPVVIFQPISNANIFVTVTSAVMITITS